MKQFQHENIVTNVQSLSSVSFCGLIDKIEKSWECIAPFWRLENLIAINPLKGFEKMPYEKALVEGARLFQSKGLPKPMSDINRQTIKWCQVILDRGQATISAPMMQSNLYETWLKLIKFDKTLHQKNTTKMNWLQSLPNDPESAILVSLIQLNIPQKHWTEFLTLMLTTLSGWASYIQYLNDWDKDSDDPKKLSKSEYLAIRLVITYLLYPNALELLDWSEQSKNQSVINEDFFSQLEEREKEFSNVLLDKIVKKSEQIQKNISSTLPEAQFVFCIDVRSESVRRAIESVGTYQTFGMAGFFGVPITFNHTINQETRTCLPVLASAQGQVHETPVESKPSIYDRSKNLKSVYKRLKYNFATPFGLAESTGLFYAGLMAMKTLFPKLTSAISQKALPNPDHSEQVEMSLDHISLEDRINYAMSALRSIGLTKNFSSLVVFCGHNSTTDNNAFASSLQCGACGGNSGASNAQLIANILNQSEIRKALKGRGILIPKHTVFMGACHNTTTDEIKLYYDTHAKNKEIEKKIENIKRALLQVQEINARYRLAFLETKEGASKSKQLVKNNACDWAQIRPEWGLAKNAAFIIGPRTMTEQVDLEGRVFLHSYDFEQDEDNTILTSIMTAPMVVAFWINSQYFFSTFDNVAFGAGSKITKNITGRMGVMQGNASDLMHGLPLQSVFLNNHDAYHELLRLQVFVVAPLDKVKKVLHENPAISQLCLNGWIKLFCLDPNQNKRYILKRTGGWLLT